MEWEEASVLLYEVKRASFFAKHCPIIILQEQLRASKRGPSYVCIYDFPPKQELLKIALIFSWQKKRFSPQELLFISEKIMCITISVGFTAVLFCFWNVIADFFQLAHVRT